MRMGLSQREREEQEFQEMIGPLKDRNRFIGAVINQIVIDEDGLYLMEVKLMTSRGELTFGTVSTSGLYVEINEDKKQ